MGSWSISSAAHPESIRVGIVSYGEIGNPDRRPSPPVIATVEPRDGAVLVTWFPPQSSGGFGISHYLVEAQPGPTTCLVDVVVDPSLSCLIEPLVNGRAYHFTVSALGGGGWSDPSMPSQPVAPIATATPVTPPNPTPQPIPTREPTPSPGPTPDPTPDPTPLPEPERLTLALGSAAGEPLRRVSVRPVRAGRQGPVVTVDSGDWLRLTVKGLARKSRAVVAYRTQGEWLPLMRGTTSRAGALRIASLEVRGSGEVQVRVSVRAREARLFILRAR